MSKFLSRRILALKMSTVRASHRCSVYLMPLFILNWSLELKCLLTQQPVSQHTQPRFTVHIKTKKFKSWGLLPAKSFFCCHRVNEFKRARLLGIYAIIIRGDEKKKNCEMKVKQTNKQTEKEGWSYLHISPSVLQSRCWCTESVWKEERLCGAI